jgi:predicted dehydrogenase
MKINSNTVLPKRLGFIGGSIQSAVGLTHCVASQLDNRWKLVSGCFSRNKDISMDTGLQWGLSEEKIFSDWKEYINSEKSNVDAIVVLTPTPEHCKIVKFLLENDIPVICEKAMVANLKESEEIRQVLEDRKGFLAVTFNYSGYPMIRELRSLLLDNKLGKLTQIQIEMPSDGFIKEKHEMCPQKWRLSDGKIPTILLDLGVHLHHLTSFITNLKPISVNADFNHFSIFDDIVDDAHMWVNYENDFRASLWVSKTALGYQNGLKLRVFGELGSAEWYQEEPENLHMFSKNSTRTTYGRGNCVYGNQTKERFKPGHPAGFIEAFANLYSDIADALNDYKNNDHWESSYVFGWEHANEGLTLLEAASSANSTRLWTDVKGYK